LTPGNGSGGARRLAAHSWLIQTRVWLMEGQQWKPLHNLKFDTDESPEQASHQYPNENRNRRK
jgi:hypothetical protein